MPPLLAACSRARIGSGSACEVVQSCLRLVASFEIVFVGVHVVDSLALQSRLAVSLSSQVSLIVVVDWLLT